MAITSFDTLKTAISDWNPHTDLPNKAEALIQLAESRMNQDLRVRQMQETDTGTTTSGTAEVNLPYDFLELVEVRIVTTANHVLERRPLADLLDRTMSATTGIPGYFAIRGAQLVLGPTPGSDYDYSLTYYQKIPALSSGQTSNWVIDDAPNLYLFACLCEAERFLLNAEGVAWWDSQYVGARNAMVGMDRRSRFYGGRQGIRVA